MTDYLDDDSFAEGAKVVATPAAKKPKVEEEDDSFAEGAKVVSSPTAAANDDAFAEGAKVVAAPKGPVAARPRVPLYAGHEEGYEPRQPGFFEKAPSAPVPAPVASHAPTNTIPAPFQPVRTGAASYVPPKPPGPEMDPEELYGRLPGPVRQVAGVVAKGAEILGKQVERQSGVARQLARETADGILPGNTALQGAAEGVADAMSMMADPRVTYGFAAAHAAAPALLGEQGAALFGKAVTAGFGAAGAKDVTEGTTDYLLEKNITGDEDAAREGARRAAFGAGLVIPTLGAPALETFLGKANETAGKRAFAETMNRVAANYSPEQAAKRAGLLRDIGLPETATDEQIASAVKRVVKETHPDKPENVWDPASQQRFNRAIEARDQMPEEQIWEDPLAVPGKNLPNRIVDAGRALSNAVKLGDWEGATNALRVIRDPAAEAAPNITREVAPAPRIDLPRRPVPPGMRLGAPNDRVERQGVPSEVGVGQEPVQAGPVEGRRGETPETGRMVQGAQAGLAPEPGGHVPQAAERTAGAGRPAVPAEEGLKPEEEKVQGEAPADMKAQENALLAGARQAILWHKNGPQPDSAFPPTGIEQVQTPAGLVWFRSDSKLSPERVKEMASSVEGLGQLLEMPAGGRPNERNPKNITVLDADGNEVWSAEVTDKTRQSALKRAAAMAEKIGGNVVEQTRKDTVEGRRERIKEQKKQEVPAAQATDDFAEGAKVVEAPRAADRPYEEGETILYTPLSGKEKEGVIGSVLDNGKFRVVDRQGMASIVGPEKMRRPSEPAKPEAPAGAGAPQPGDTVRYRFANGQEETGKVVSAYDDGHLVVARPGGGESPIAPTPTDAKGKKRNHLVSIVQRADEEGDAGGRPGNPFREKAIAARAKADALNRPTAHEQGMANAFPLGAGFGRPGDKGKRIDRSVNRAVAAVQATKDAEYLEAQADAFDRGEINAQGRSQTPEQETRRETAREKADEKRARIEAAKAQREGKEPWQVTQQVYAEAAGVFAGSGRDLVNHDHREAVAKAIAEGKPVPPDVLAEYEAGGPAKPAKKDKAKKAPPSVDMNRQAVANHLKLTVGSGWEEELVGLDRAAMEFEAEGEGTKAQFWKDLAASTIGAAPEAKPEPKYKPVEAPKVETKSWENAATGPEGVVETATGTEIPFTYAVVEADEPITSHDSAGNPNRGYALEGENIQNRDRSDEKSVEQMGKIKGNPKLRLLAESPTTNDGAPLVRPDKRVLAGNGRMAGLAAAHEAGTAEQYKKDLPAKLKQLGFDEAAIEKAMSMERPALVRLMKPGFEYDQTRLARDTNVSTGLQLGPAEKGRSDAGLMMAPASAETTSRVLAQFHPDEDGNLAAPSNREFAHAFAKAFVPETERGGMFRDGELNPDGAARIRAALIAAAYGDSKVVDRLLEGGGEETAALRSALLNAAPSFAAVNLKQKTGELDPLDVTKPVIETAEFINDMRASGRKLQDVLHPKYGELISATDRLSPEGLELVLLTEPLKFEKKQKDDTVKITTESSSAMAKRLTGTLKELAKVALALTKVETAGGLFGADEMAALVTEPPTLAEAIKIARQNYELAQEAEDAPLLAGTEPRAPKGPGAGAPETRGAGEKEPGPGEGTPPDDQLREADAEYGQPAIAAPTFFSAAERAIDAMPFKSMPASDLLMRLVKTPGVKRDESGVDGEWAIWDPADIDGPPLEEGFATRVEAEDRLHDMFVNEQMDRLEAETAPGVTVHSISITPAMREAALSGQALFEKKTTYDPRQRGLFDDGDTGSLRKPGEEAAPAAAGRADQSVLPAAPVAGEDRGGLGLSAKSSRYSLGQLAARRAEAEKRGRAQIEKLVSRLRASVPGGVDPDNDPLVIEATKIAKTFRSGGFVSLIGHDVPDLKALGVVAQVAANPAYETLRVALLDDDNVLVQEIPLSAHLPAGVSAHLAVETGSIATEMKLYGATKWALIHNHPGGDATPSAPDVAFTTKRAGQIPGFMGHVVIDHDSFATIDATGKVTMHDLDETAKARRPKIFEDPDATANAKHLGVVCNGPEDVAKLAINLHTKERSVTLLYVSRIGKAGVNKIRAIGSVPFEKFLDFAWATRRLRLEQGFHGAQHVLAYSSGKGLSVAEKIQLVSVAQDLAGVNVEGGATLSDFLLGEDPRMSLNAQGITRESSQGVTNATNTERIAEADVDYGDEKSARKRAFDRWFEGSVVTNEDGTPKVMYHGTHSEHDFDTFWTKGYQVDLGAHFGTKDQANDIIGTRELMKSGEQQALPGSTKALHAVRASSLKRIYPVYLSIKNPMRLPDLGGWVSPRSYVANIPASATGDEGDLRAMAEKEMEKYPVYSEAREAWPPKVKAFLEERGYDGVVYVNENEATDEEADSYIAFHPWQIKSATGNKGTFDPENKSIINEPDSTYGAPPTREKGIPEDAPHVALARNTTALKSDPDYAEAKAGDREAAVRLVNRLVTPEAIRRAKAFGKDVTFVFPHAEEAAGRNKIPATVAAKLAVETGGNVADDIVQSNRVYHTGASAKQRFISRPTFDGPVEKGARYVLVDDVTTFGSTLAELANHIQKNGGEVAGTFLLADSSRTPTLTPDRRRVDALEQRLGTALRETLGLDPAALTRPEVDYFLGFKSPESLRATVATARRERDGRLRAKGVREDEAPYGKKSALDYASRFAPGASRALKPRGPEDEVRLAATDPTAGVFSAIFASRAPKASKTSQLPSPTDSHDPEVERRMRAAEGIVAPTILDRVKKAARDLEHSFTRHFIELDTKESSTLALDVDILRQLEGSPDFAKQAALDSLQYIADGLDKPAARLFTRILALRDLHRSIDEGLYEDKDELPFGYEDKAAVTYDLRRYEAMAEKDEAVAAALTKREKFADELTQKLVDMELLPEDVLEDDRYYHRQVMAIFNQKEAAYVGTGSQDVRLHKKGFQKARSGGGDFNLRYQEAEFEWMAQGHALIAMREALDRLREANDIKPGLDQRAKWQNTLAIYGGIENYNEVQRLKGELAAIYTGGDIVLDSEDRKRVAAINQQLEELDPLRPFSQRIGWNIHDLKKKAEHGELDHVDKRFQEAVDQLAMSSEWEEFRGEEDTPDLFFPLLNHLLEKGKGGSQEAAGIFKAIADRKKFIKTELGKEFKTWRDLIPETHPMAPKSRAVVWQPEKGSMFYRAQTLPERALERFVEDLKEAPEEAIDREELEKLLGKAREALVLGGPKPEWVIPEGLAKTLDNWKGSGRERGLESIHGSLLQAWKQWVLLNPVRALRYNLNNESGDVDIVIAAFPGALRGWTQAARDLWNYTVKEDKSDQKLVAEIQRAMKLGVISSGQAVQEIPDINEAGAFKGLTSEDPNVVQKALETYWAGTKKASTWRENTLRLALFRYLEPELARGAKIYGSSKPHEVDAIKDPSERAAKITRELIGDYGNISVAGQWIRRHLMPFYSWLEINTPRYVRLMKNASRDGGTGGEGGGKRAGRVAGIGAKKIAVNYAKLALLAPLLYGAIQAWNNIVFPEEEKLLGSDRKRLRIILGRNVDGSIRTLRLQGALSDALDWFGAGNLVADVKDVAEGRRTVRNKVNDAITSPIDKIVGAWEPFSKSVFELAFGYKSYPSLFKEGSLELAPPKIRDRAEYAGDIAWPVGALYRKVTGKPKRPSPDLGIPGAGPILDALLVTRTDPGEAAYWYTRNAANKWLEDQGKSPSTGGPTGDMKDRADALYYFKKACEWGDDSAASKWLVEYYRLGGTPQKMNESFVREHPLGGLPLGKRGAFLNTLSDKDRTIVQNAVGWYEKGRERGRGVSAETTYVPTPHKATTP